MFNFKVISSQAITSSVFLLTLHNESGKDFQFQAGQYAALHFRGHGRPSAVRCFSIVSSSTQTDTIQFAIHITGGYSARLSQLAAGDSVFVQGPFGDFVIDPAQDSSIVMLAAGIGITPFVSMLRSLPVGGPKVVLLYATKPGQGIAFGSQLRKLETSHSNLHVLFVRPDGGDIDLPGAHVVHGRIDEALIGQVVTQSLANTTYFLCGPPKFMDSVASILVRKGVYEDHLMLEAFGQRKLGGLKLNTSAPRRIYIATALSLLVGAGIFVLSNVSPSTKLASSKSTTATTPTTTTEAIDDDTATTNNAATATTDSSTDTSSSTATTTTPTTTTTYSTPSSSVS